MTEEELMQRGQELAKSCADAQVPDNQLALVLAHLTRHHNLEGTLLMVERLPKSPFGKRSKRTREQLEKLEIHVNRALREISGWHEAAQVVGWGKRLYSFYGRS
jgi:hypothetical protein